MDILKRVIGIFLILAGIAVAGHLIVEPLYHTSTEADPSSPLWQVFHPVVIAAIVFTLIFSYARKRDVEQGWDGSVVSREFLSANVSFYGSLVVGILYFWNWFNDLSPAFTAIGGDVITITWTIVGVALLPLSAAMGVSMLKSNR